PRPEALALAGFTGIPWLGHTSDRSMCAVYYRLSQRFMLSIPFGSVGRPLPPTGRMCHEDLFNHLPGARHEVGTAPATTPRHLDKSGTSGGEKGSRDSQVADVAAVAKHGSLNAERAGLYLPLAAVSCQHIG